MAKISKLAEFIHSELQQGKTIAEIKRDVKISARGWTNKEVSKAIHAAVRQELENRKPAKPEAGGQYAANKMWLAAIASAVIAVIALAALFLYLFRE